MIEETLSEREARRFYDRYGKKLEFSDHFEGKAKALAWSWCQLAPGLRVLELGVGTGAFQAYAAAELGHGPRCAGVDTSQTMLDLSRQKAPHNGLVQASAPRLPFGDGAFDLVFSSYVLDLLPLRVIEEVVPELGRVLDPEGRLVICSLTEGRSWLEILLMGLWKRIHALSPAKVGGCRPLVLGPLLEAGGFRVERRQHVGQLGTPSEVLEATRAR